MTDNVLVLGGGAREHALAWTLAKSPQVQQVAVAPGNAGTVHINKVTNTDLNIKDHNAIIQFCKAHDIKLVVVGPEDPLANGITDDLSASGIPCFGPSRLASQLESSKEFSKVFMDKYSIPTAKWKSFTDPTEAKDYINKATHDALVVKADGLAAGKGVVVAANKKEATEAVDMMLKDKTFGQAGETVVVEELLRGEEVSVLAFSDGVNIAVMPPAQDHKRIFDGDKGPNTGGMGAYAPCPLVSKEMLAVIKRDVIRKAIDGMNTEGIPFVGCLFAGIMLTDDGPKVLEYNCRFGDPETEAILPLLESDLYPTLVACVKGNLSEAKPIWQEDRVALGIVMASAGYPASYEKGKKITGLDYVSQAGDVHAFHAGTSRQGDDVLTSGGRVLVVVGLASTLLEAVSKAKSAVAKITFEGAQYRRDIGHKALNRLTYKSAGVDIDAGDHLVSSIKELVMRTNRPGVVGGIGGFGGVFDLGKAGYKDPLLISGTDGVGTKLKVAQACGIHNTVGEDLVAMCVNDILTQGAESLFFLDYFGCGRLDVGVANQVVAGVANGCHLANCALIGGETAEMPGMYPDGDYDLAGFAVGAVEKEHLLPRIDQIQDGDILIGLPSSGLHSNGFSLIRKLVEKQGLKYSDPAPYDSTRSLGESLLTPTRIYVRSLLPLLQGGLIKAASHITGGGLTENIPRVLPDHVKVTLDAMTWAQSLHPVYRWIAQSGAISNEEMLRTFNCGLGMVLVVDTSQRPEVLRLLKKDGAVCVGTVNSMSKDEQIVRVSNISAALQAPNVVSLRKKKVGVLISGSGTNLQSLINYTQNPLNESMAEITLVVSNIANVEGLARAQRANINTKVISHKQHKNRVDFDMAVNEALLAAGVEVVCLAGFMRILSAEFVQIWHGRLLNVHPSLLPSFRGMHAHRQALQAGVTVTGCTVHFVDSGVDTGGIILQEPVYIAEEETEDTLTERVKLAEHKIYPLALELVAQGRIILGENGAVFRK